MEKRNSVRDSIIDTLKGLCIVLMVAGHCGAPGTSFIYLFHMAVFFIASGYVYKEQVSDNLHSLVIYISKRIRSLYIPYAMAGVIFSIFHNLFVRINVYTNNPLLLERVARNSTFEIQEAKQIITNVIKSMLLHNNTQMGGALWFLAVLFELSVLYAFIDYLLKKVFNTTNTIIGQSIFSIVFLVIGYYGHVAGNEFYGCDKVFSYYSLFHMGIIINHSRIYIKQKRVLWKMCCFVFLAFVVLIGCQNFGTIALDKNSYCNPIFLLVASSAGWCFVYEISSILEYLNLNQAIVYLGNNTLPVVILHFLSFKIVNFAGVLLTKDSLYMAAAFPILYREKLWWIVYLIIGVFVPLLTNHVYKLVKNNFETIYTKII